MFETNDARGGADPEEAVEDRRPPYAVAIGAASAVLLLYVVTLAPTISFWDASEYIATAHIMGVPHPAGNPLFVVLAKAWSLLLAPTGLPVAVRVNLFAAVTSAAASGFFFLVAHRVLANIFPERRLALVGAACSTLIGATAFTVWNQSNTNEKVYTVSLLIIAIVSWLALLWYDRREEEGSERLLLWAGFLLVLGVTNHMMSMLPGPALLFLVLLVKPSLLLRPSFAARGVLLVALGLSFNYVLPIRSAQDPYINEAEPTCDSFVEASTSVFTLGRSGCRALSDVLTREQYQTPPVWQRKAPFRAQMQNYYQYFDWQWSRGLDASPVPSPSRLPFTALFLGLGVTGLLAVWRADRALFAYIGALTATVTVGLVVYMNFRYGFSLSPEITDPAMHEVRERDYFFIVGFMFWGVLAGLGLAFMWDTLARSLGTARRYAASSPLLGLALLPLVMNWGWATRAGDYAARDWAYDLLMSVEPYAVLFSNGDNDTFPLWYMQEVEGVRQDVTVIVGQYLQTDWYINQLQRHTRPEVQRRFDPDLVPGLYEDRGLPPEPIISFPPEALAAVIPTRLGEDVTIGFPTLAVTYPAGMILDRSHQLALSIIRDSVEHRPIYFTASGGMLNEIGLGRWGVRHGLATKLELRLLDDPEANAGWVQGSEGFGQDWFDLEHSLELYDEVYQYRSLKDREIWSDRATLNIPQQYYVMAALLADAAEQDGRPRALIDRLQVDAVDFQIVALGGVAGTPGAELQ